MALDRLTQITSSGISSTSTITVSAVAGVVTATTLSVTGSVTTGLDVSGIVTATTVQVGSATTIHTTGIDLGGGTLTSHNINSTGIITATGGFVGAVTGNVTGDLSGNVSGTAVTATTASFTNATISGDLTVQGTTTTLDTTLTEVDKLEVGANNTTVGVAITQSGTGDILRLYDSGTQVVTVADGGSVGIGTDNPGTKLDILNGSDAAVIATINGANNSSEYLGLGINGSDAIITGGGNGSTSTNLVFRTSASGTEIERLRISSSGNVGIGTDNPIAKLHVNGGVAVRGPATPNINLTPLSGVSGNADISFDGNDLRIVSNSSSADVRINAYSRNNDFVLKQSGNIGIGTDNPEVKCVVYSTSAEVVPFRVKSGDTSTNGSFIGFENIGNSPNGYNTRCGVIDSTSFSIFTSNNERLRIDSSGKIGIGITNPSGKLTVYDNSQNFNDGQNLIRLEYPGSYNQGDIGGGIVFSQHWFSGDTARARTGGIYGVKTGQSGIFGGGLAIYTQPHSGDPMQELVRLSGRQRIGIGHTDPLSKVEIQGSGDGGSGVTGLSDLTTKSSLLIKGLSGSSTSLMAGVRSTGGQFIQGAYRAETTVSVRDISINPYGGSVSLGGVASNFGGVPDSGGADVKIYTTASGTGLSQVIRAYYQPNGSCAHYTGGSGLSSGSYGRRDGFGMGSWIEGYGNNEAYQNLNTAGTFWHESLVRGTSSFSNVGLISFQGSGNFGIMITVEYWMHSAVGSANQYGKLAAWAWRTSNNNMNISTENTLDRDYFGNGGASEYINLSWGSSGSGSTQVLTLRVSSDAVYNGGSYTRTLFRTTYVAHDYVHAVTVLR